MLVCVEFGDEKISGAEDRTKCFKCFNTTREYLKQTTENVWSRRLYWLGLAHLFSTWNTKKIKLLSYCVRQEGCEVRRRNPSFGRQKKRTRYLHFTNNGSFMMAMGTFKRCIQGHLFLFDNLLLFLSPSSHLLSLTCSLPNDGEKDSVWKKTEKSIYVSSSCARLFPF